MIKKLNANIAKHLWEKLHVFVFIKNKFEQ